MPPLRQAPKPAPAPSRRSLEPPTGVAKLTPKAAAVEETARELRRVLGRFATGVTVVTTTERDTIQGMTVNAFLSVSLQPPLVLVSLGRSRRSPMNEILARTRRYGVSVLCHDQEQYAAHFAGQRPSPVEPKFVWHGGIPLLAGALAHLVCRVVDFHQAGDHVLWIGAVEHLDHRDAAPLLFYTGRFGTLPEVQERSEHPGGA